MAGLAHSDLSGNNVLMDPSNGTCMVIDIDSLVVPGIYPSKVLGTRGYMAPEVVITSQMPLKHPDKTLPSIKTDLHSLAVIIYETLLLRHPLKGKKIYSEDPDKDDLLRFGKKALFIEDPSDHSNRPDNPGIPLQALGPHLVPVFQRAFADGLHNPDERPTAYEWEKALTYTTDILYPCQGDDCWHKWFVCQKNFASECLFCGWKPSEPISIMHLFRKYKPGQYLSERHYLTIWDRKKLYMWHTRSDVSYPADISDDPEGEGNFRLQNGSWVFKNESSDKMICSASERINPGDSVEISKNKTMLLCDHPKGRLAMFEIL